MRALLSRAALSCCALSLCLAGCDDDPAPAAPAASASAADAGASTRRGPGQAGDAGGPPVMPITQQSFMESDAVRDPFRSFATMFVTRASNDENDTRAVVLGRYTLDDLRLVAVVLGTDSPYAMVVDPSHAGTILRRGVLVGRAETVRSPTQDRPDSTVHWRVARIIPVRLRRNPDGSMAEIPAELVFERNDPFNPNAAVVERSLSLTGQGAGAGQGQTLPSPVGLPLPGMGQPVPTFLPGGLPGPSGPRTTTTTTSGPQGQQTTTQTTVIVQPPQATQTTTQPVIPTTPPPVQITGGDSPLRTP